MIIVLLYPGGSSVSTKNRRGSRHLLLVFAIGFAMALPVFAQIGGSGTIQGSVTDPTGAVIPGATVAATNVGTQVKTTRQTTDAGYYVISPLPAGQYTVTVT